MATNRNLGLVLVAIGLVLALGSFLVTHYSYYILVAVVAGLLFILAGIGQLTGGGSVPWVNRVFAAIGILLLIGSFAVVSLKIREPDITIIFIGVVAMAIIDFARSLRRRHAGPR